MNRPAPVEAVGSIDDLELELRKLPGVRSAGFDESDDVLLVQLHVADRKENIDRTDRDDIQPEIVAAVLEVTDIANEFGRRCKKTARCSRPEWKERNIDARAPGAVVYDIHR